MSGNSNTTAPTAVPKTTGTNAAVTTNSGSSSAAQNTGNNGVLATNPVPYTPVPGSFAAKYAPFSPTTPGTGPTKRKATGGTPKKRRRRKKIKKTVIDDEVAVQIFKCLRLCNKFLNSGRVLAWALQPDDPAFVNIHNYICASQEHGFGVKILSILRVISKTDQDPVAFSDDPNVKGQHRMMLWHGTKSYAIASILQNSLRLPRRHGQMFGAGIYFADRVSKSCQYCDRSYNNYTSQPGGLDSVGYLFLCDVLLGNMKKAYNALGAIRAPPDTFDSIKGCGRNVPAPEWSKMIDGCIWPIGPTVENREDGGQVALNYNEYIVYKTEQVQPKYLVKVEFVASPVAEILF